MKVFVISSSLVSSRLEKGDVFLSSAKAGGEVFRSPEKLLSGGEGLSVESAAVFNGSKEGSGVVVVLSTLGLLDGFLLRLSSSSSSCLGLEGVLLRLSLALLPPLLLLFLLLLGLPFASSPLDEELLGLLLLLLVRVFRSREDRLDDEDFLLL